jgi:hypothetical protein
VDCPQLPCRYPDSDYIKGGLFLFNVVEDPFEHHNVARANPDIVQKLLARLEAYNSTQIPQKNSAKDPAR